MFPASDLRKLTSLFHHHAEHLTRHQTARYRTTLDDLLQAAWVEVCRRQHRWDGRESLVTFHYLRSRGAMIEELRRLFGHESQVRKPTLPLTSLTTSQRTCRANSPFEQLVKREKVDRLRKAWQTLSRRQKQVLIGRVVREERMYQTAKRLGVSPSRVSQLQQEAVKKLRNALEQDLVGGMRT